MRYLLLCLPILCLPLLAEIEHGTIELLGDPVVTNADLSLGSVTTSGVSLPTGTNQGDYLITIDPPGTQDEGIIIASVAQNTRGGGRAVAAGYPSVAPNHWISVSPAAAGGEDDINVAFALFPKDEFLVGQATNPSNNAALDNLAFESAGINFSTALGQNPGAEFVYTGSVSGVSTLDLTGLGASSQDGILLTNGARNDNNFALSKANPDGTFTLYCHDANVNGDTYEQDRVSFVYIPVAHGSSQIHAMGRIKGDTTKLLSDGEFNVTDPSNSVWHISIPNHSNSTGTLIITPEGGDGGNVDNPLSYEWDDSARHWVVHTPDLTGLAFLSNSSDEPVFSFVFLALEPRVGIVHVDENAAPGGDGTSWATAYQDLNEAIDDLRVGDEIWIAEGTYRPATADGFVIDVGDVELYGGFPIGGGDGTFAARNPDPATNNTILSGDIDLDGDLTWPDAQNAIHVANILPHITDCIIDGFTITGGNADGSGDEGRGGAVFVDSNSSPTFQNILFFRNNCIDDGGAVMIASGGTVVPTFTDVTFANNTSSDAGAALYHWNRSSNCTNVIFRNNGSLGAGGAVYNDDTASTFTNCLFHNNSSDTLGGAVGENAGSSTTWVNCTFSANNAVSDGGGIYSTAATITLHNTILWNNSGTPENELAGATLDAASSNNLIQGASVAGAIISNTDPLFEDPDGLDNLGGTEDDDYRLTVGSPVLNLGDESALPSGTDTDLADFPRIANYALDLGAYEKPYAELAPPPVISTADGNPASSTDWISSPNFTGDGGFTYTLTLLGSNGDLTTDSAPAVQPDGSLGYTLTNGTTGFLRYQLDFTDPSGIYAPETHYFTLRTPGQRIYVDQSATGLGTGASWEDAVPELREVVSHMVTGEEIWIAQGTYTPTDNNDRSDHFDVTTEISIYGGFPAGGGDGTMEARTADALTNATILSGEIGDPGLLTDNTSQIMRIFASLSPTLDGLTFQHGYSSSGAGLYVNDNSDPIIRNCYFTENTVTNKGGGVYFEFSCDAIIEDCVFYDNSAYDGGGLFVSRSSDPRVRHCSFIGNNAEKRGGGMFIGDFTFSSTDGMIENCLFSGNTTPAIPNSGGAGLALGVYSRTKVRSCTFVGNSGGSAGGALYNGTGPDSEFLNCLIWGNSSTSSDPLADTIYYNQLLSFTQPFSSFTNCIVEHSGGSGINWETGVRSSSTGLDGIGIDGGGNIDADPQLADPDGPDDIFGTLDDNGRLTPASIAINNGDNSFSTQLTDLVGNLRISDSTIDIGAIEFPNRLYVDQSNTGTTDGQSWATAFTDLQDALAIVASDGEIWIAEGTYKPTPTTSPIIYFSPNGAQKIYGGFPSGGGDGTFEARDPNPRTNGTILSGYLDASNKSSYVILLISPATPTIDGLTIRDGRTGILINPNTSVSMENVIIRNNDNTASDGGGIRCGSSTLSTFKNCYIEENSTDDSGGGLGYFNTGGKTKFIQCVFSGNTAVFNGGAIAVGGETTLVNCSIVGNTANRGGGLYFRQGNTGTITSTLISDNVSTLGFNAIEDSIYRLSTATVSFENSLVENSGGSTAWDPAVGIDLGSNLDGDPLFTDADGADDIFGTADDNLLVLPGSPALDTGLLDPSTGDFDITGRFRVIDAAIDIGAFESGSIVWKVDSQVPTPGDGRSWPDAFDNLHDALQIAFDDDSIWIAEGTYKPTETTNRQIHYDITTACHLYGGFPVGGGDGTFAARDGDPLTNNTILSGNIGSQGSTTDNTDKVVRIFPSLDPTLDGLTIRDGYATSGAGVFVNQNSEPTFHNILFTQNRGTSNGGAVYLENQSHANFTDCQFVDNLATRGGAVYALSSGPQFIHCQFSQNDATSNGGAIELLGTPSQTTVISHCEFIENDAASNAGALNNGQPSVDISDSLFEANTARYGGAIYASAAGSIVIEQCRFVGNSAEQGGGIGLFLQPGDIRNTLFSGNQANTGLGQGGAIYQIAFNAGSSNFDSCTFAGNSATSGDSINILIFNAGEVPTVNNCIFWNGDGSTHISGNTLDPASQGNLIESGHPTGTDTLTSDPRFIDADGPDNILGTADDDLRLQPTSPAINTGINGVNTATTDLDGNTRIVGNVIDRGAFESIYATFAAQHPGLTELGDDNNNGITNFTEYAAGLDPTANSNSPIVTPFNDANGKQLTVLRRNNAADVSSQLRKTPSLLPPSWSNMVEGIDYNISDTATNGDQTTLTLELLTTEETLFFREEFSSP